MPRIIFVALLALLSLPIVHAENAHQGTKVEVIANATESWDGDLLPPYPSGQPEIKILRITIPPKTALPMHINSTLN